MARFYIETLQRGEWKRYTIGYFDTKELAEENLRNVLEVAKEYGAIDPQARIHEMTSQEIAEGLIAEYPSVFKSYLQNLPIEVLQEIVLKSIAAEESKS